MGRRSERMDENQRLDKKGNGSKPHQLRQEAQLRADLEKNSAPEGKVTPSDYNNQTPDAVGQVTSDTNGAAASRLIAATSSPSLLQGCSDSTTHAGAVVEKHVHSHNVDVNIIPHSPVSPADFTAPSFPEHPPDSLFLTPSPSRSRQSSERPYSAPSYQLERISGTLLRLVGDHYLCSTCGRQLRTIGDQMAFEANIRRTLSASHLEIIHHND